MDVDRPGPSATPALVSASVNLGVPALPGAAMRDSAPHRGTCRPGCDALHHMSFPTACLSFSPRARVSLGLMVARSWPTPSTLCCGHRGVCSGTLKTGDRGSSQEKGTGLRLGSHRLSPTASLGRSHLDVTVTQVQVGT